MGFLCIKMVFLYQNGALSGVKILKLKIMKCDSFPLIVTLSRVYSSPSVMANAIVLYNEGLILI